jgi:hypothetical protein
MRDFSSNYEPVPDLRGKQFFDIGARRLILQMGPCHILSTQDRVNDTSWQRLRNVQKPVTVKRTYYERKWQLIRLFITCVQQVS